MSPRMPIREGGARSQGALAICSSLTLVLAMLAASLAALRAVIVPGPWVAQVFLLLAAVAIIILVARLIVAVRTRGEPSLRAALLPSLAATVFAVWLILARFGSPHDGGFSALISPAHFDRIGWLLIGARRETLENMAPIEASEPILLMTAGGLALVLILADLIANALRMPALTIITVIPVWVPPLMLVSSVPLAPMCVVWGCFLGLLAIDNPWRTTPRFPHSQRGAFVAAPLAWLRLRTPALPRALTTVVGIAVCSALVLALTPHLPFWRQVDIPSDTSSKSSDLRLSDTLDVRQNLGPRAETVVYTYSLDDPKAVPGPLRSTTLAGFDGRTWTPNPAGDGVPLSQGELLWPSLSGPTNQADELGMYLIAEGLRDTSLPIPLEPRSVFAVDSARYVSATDVLRLDQPTKQGDEFRFYSYDRALTPDGLRSSAIAQSALLHRLKIETASGKWKSFGSDEGPALVESLAIPASEHIGDITALAQKVVKDAGKSDYDSVLALQNYLRDPARFTYSLTVPRGRTNDPVWDFLTDKSGYCVQFASAMTVMARSLGLPARIGVGFLPGDLDSSGNYVVRGKDAHAWTEILFEDVGWVRFEPTPASQSGPAPAWAPVGSDVDPKPTPKPTSTSAKATPKPSASTTTQQSSTTPLGSPTLTTAGSAGTPTQFVGLGIITLAVVVAAALLWFMRGRRRRGPVALESAWDTVLKHAAQAGIVPPPSATVRTIAAILEPSGSGAVHDLALVVEATRYAPDAPPEALIPSAIEEARAAAVASVISLHGTAHADNRRGKQRSR